MVASRSRQSEGAPIGHALITIEFWRFLFATESERQSGPPRGKGPTAMKHTTISLREPYSQVSLLFLDKAATIHLKLIQEKRVPASWGADAQQ